MAKHDPLGPRRLTLADLQILVAAAGAAAMVLAMLRREEEYVRARFNPVRPLPTGFWPWLIRLLAVLVVASLALLVLRLRQPRPSRWRCFRQPGTAACVASIFSASLSVLRNVMDVNPYSIANPLAFYICGLDRIGSSVVLVWLTLALAGAWRPAPDWIDRSGRVLGVILIAVYVFSMFSFLVL
jgi:hypothetical protein